MCQGNCSFLTGDVEGSARRVKSSGRRRLSTVGQPSGPGQDGEAILKKHRIWWEEKRAEDKIGQVKKRKCFFYEIRQTPPPPRLWTFLSHKIPFLLRMASPINNFVKHWMRKCSIRSLGQVGQCLVRPAKLCLDQLGQAAPREEDQVQSILRLLNLEVMDQGLICTQWSNQSAVIPRKDRIDNLYPIILSLR